MATIYKASGEQTNIAPKNRKFFELKELQHIVGGYIQNVYLNDGTILILNEDGKLEQLSLNTRATEIFRKSFPDSPDYIVGDALITESKFIK
jgi:hypothetical protein